MYIVGSEDRIPSENVSCFFLFSHKECYRFSRLACENGTHLHDFGKKELFLTNLIRFGYTSLKIRN